VSVNLHRFEVFGVDEYGAVQLECQDCELIIAEGGCTCCKDNAATLAMLVRTARDHMCPGPSGEDEDEDE
jgi:hypothetical protein